MRGKGGWFEVDKEGLAALVGRRGHAFILHELVQNALDEKGVTRVDVSVSRTAAADSRTLVSVTDDGPGFHDLSHAFTLFAPSYKAKNPEQRGRFNLGEKLVLSLADEAKIVSTTGCVIFDKRGRTVGTRTREWGTQIVAKLRLSVSEMTRMIEESYLMLAPERVMVSINDKPLPAREVLATIPATLPTEIGGDDGSPLRRTERSTTVLVIKPLNGEAPHLYEMGIPVMEIDCPWHVSVEQKVPLNLERESVPPSFRRKLLAAVLDVMAKQVEEPAAGWVAESLPAASVEAVRTVVTKRFGSNALTFDPTSPEANKRALEEGRQLVYGGTFDRAGWSAVKRAFAGTPTLAPAGQVIKVGVETAPDGVPPIPYTEWTSAMHRMADYSQGVSRHVNGRDIVVHFYQMPLGDPHAAWYGRGQLSFNLRRLGKRWVEDPDQEKVDALLIHELAHEQVADHLSDGFHEECCRIGARLRSFPDRLVE
jgi:hypothetical protein